jgi:hypothetical protein
MQLAFVALGLRLLHALSMFESHDNSEHSTPRNSRNWRLSR